MSTVAHFPNSTPEVESMEFPADADDSEIRNTACCRYCGQIVCIDDYEPRSDAEAVEIATLRCTCHLAVRYRDDTIAKRRAEEERARTLERARDQIDDMFGSGAEKYSLLSFGPDIRRLLYDAAVLIYDRHIRDISININSWVKVRISISSKGKIMFFRSDVTAFKQEA